MLRFGVGDFLDQESQVVVQICNFEEALGIGGIGQVGCEGSAERVVN